MGGLWNWWRDLFGDELVSGFVAVVLGVIVAGVTLLLAATALIWTIAGLKWFALTVRDGYRGGSKDGPADP